MKITREVITDLLPVYLAGEASEDTRALVEEFFREDPEFAARVAEQHAPPLQVTLAIPQENEMKTLENTRSLLRKRSLYLGFAIFFTLFPLSFRVGPDGFHWIWENSPAVIGVSLSLAVLLWIHFTRTSRSLRGSDL